MIGVILIMAAVTLTSSTRRLVEPEESKITVELQKEVSEYGVSGVQLDNMYQFQAVGDVVCVGNWCCSEAGGYCCNTSCEFGNCCFRIIKQENNRVYNLSTWGYEYKAPVNIPKTVG